jgi:RNA polymerase sigma factor (sigma-70 family)
MDWSDLEAVYERYHQQLYRYCYSIVGNAEDAQDALQNAMVKAVRALPSERREIQLKPWLYRIAHNESIELLRKRREQVELGPDVASAAGGPAETAAQRERLRQLLGDLEQLPERQRGALVMRELSGLDFEQIGEAFGASAAVARQTVYEARLSLRQLETGREMSCEKVMHELSEADGRVTRRRDIQAHLRDCPDCRAFGESIAGRRRDLAAIAPLPAAASGALLHSLLGGGKASAGLGASVAAGAGKTVAGSLAVKSAATVAVVAVLGASVADRSGVIDISGSHRGRPDPERVSDATSSQSARQADDEALGTGTGKDTGTEGNRGGVRLSTGRPVAGGSEVPSDAKGRHHESSPGAGPTPHELPATSNHGQETAAAHGGGRAQAGSKAGGASKGHSNSQSQAPSKPPSQAKSHHNSAGNAKGHSESQGQTKGHSESPGKSRTHPEEGSSANAHPPSRTPAPNDFGPDNAPKSPLQPSETPPGQGSPKS